MMNALSLRGCLKIEAVPMRGRPSEELEITIVRQKEAF